MDQKIKFYIEKLTAAYPGITAIWLFGSRANNAFRPDSDWDLLIFADRKIFDELKRNTSFQDDEIDLMIVFSDNQFEKPWPDEEGTKEGTLTDWAWTPISQEHATYKTVKYKSERDWFKQNMQECLTLNAMKVWPC